MCIAGVADQLQTNFASDLRQILRSVFLMNVSPALEDVEINVADKSKDSTSDLFEFRASENDVIQENDSTSKFAHNQRKKTNQTNYLLVFLFPDGSNQSIYSAEEANPESDSVFEQSLTQAVSPNSSVPAARQERSASLETEIRITTNRSSSEKSQSLGDEPTTQPLSLVVTTTTNQIQCVENNGNSQHDDNNGTNDMSAQNSTKLTNNMITNNNHANSHQAAHSMDNSTLSTTTTIILTTNSRINRNALNEESIPSQQRSTYQTPPSNYSPTSQRQQQPMVIEIDFIFEKKNAHNYQIFFY